jgi:hypothetical protein
MDFIICVDKSIPYFVCSKTSLKIKSNSKQCKGFWKHKMLKENSFFLPYLYLGRKPAHPLPPPLPGGPTEAQRTPTSSSSSSRESSSSVASLPSPVARSPSRMRATADRLDKDEIDPAEPSLRPILSPTSSPSILIFPQDQTLAPQSPFSPASPGHPELHREAMELHLAVRSIPAEGIGPTRPQWTLMCGTS